MEPIELAIDPSFTLQALSYLALGICMGTCSGLIPGLHANNFALFLASMAPLLPGSPLLVGIAMLAAGVVHTYLDIVPTLAIGVPDADMAVAALPGHKLVLEGRGFEALRLSAMGSALAVALAVPLAIPITLLMIRYYPILQAHMAIVLGAVALMMIATEPSWRHMIGGVIAFFVSGTLGFLVLDMDPASPLDGGGVLAPIFGGLFGAPVIIDALQGGGVPPQGDRWIRVPPKRVAFPASAGSATGALVGYLPGVSSAIAAVVALLAIPGDGGNRAFVVATSGVNTANTVFAIFALVALGAPRTGVLVAVEDAGVPLNLPVMLASVAIAAAVGFTLVILIGDWYLVTVGGMDYTVVCGLVMTKLVVLSFLFAGWVGVVIFVASTLIGYIPVKFGAKRVHLMSIYNVLIRRCQATGLNTQPRPTIATR